MTPEERAAFLKDHRLCVVGYARRDGAAALTPVYYAMDGDDIIISTTATRAKARAVKRDARMTVCVLGEAPPFPYLTVYGRASVEEAGAVEAMRRIGERITGQSIPDGALPALEKRANDEGRVVLRVTPERFVP